MIKNIVTSVARKNVLLGILFVFFASITAKAQLESTIGIGTTVNTATSYPCPLQNASSGSRAQYLYRVAELKAAGMDSCMVLNISFNVTNLNTFNGQIDALTIKMRNTTTAALTATAWVAGATEVYAPANYVPVLGKNTLTLTTPFDWDGVNNILVEICSGSPAATSSGNVSIAQSVTTFGSSHTYAANALGNLCASATVTNTGTITNRPNITFGFEPKLLCNGFPTIGAASASPTNVCFGQSTTLSIAGVPIASGLEYQWEDSTVTTGLWSPILAPGANQKTYTTTQTVTTYYRISVKCAFTGDSVYSNIVTVTTPTLLNGNYTIDKTAPPSATNFTSFNAAYNATKCGIAGPVVFSVIPGTGPYTEQLIINGKIPNSSATNTITFMGNGETIKFTGTTNERGVVKLKNTAFFIFDSIKVDATAGTTFGIGFHLTNNADTNIIRNCNILASLTNIAAGASAGIAISGADNNAVGLGNTLCDGNILTNNTITGGYYGITMTANFGGGANIGNIASKNSIKDFYRYGVYVKGSGSTLIDQNIISRPTRSVVAAFDGVYVLDTSNTLKINGNRIFSPFKAITTNASTFIGINFDNVFAFPANDNSAINNLIYDVVSEGDQTGINNNGAANVIIEHNTISLDNDLSTVASKFTRGYSQSQAKAVGVTFGNNLITISRGGTGTKHCIYLASGAIAPIYSQGNDYYMNAAQGSNYVGFFTSNRATLLDWQLAFGNTIDMQSYSVDPVYDNTATPTPAVLLDTANFSPTNAGANDKGQPLNILQDILKAPRSTATPDFGAYEFVPPPCLGATVGITEIYINGIKVNSDTTVCESTLIKLDLKISGAYGSSQTFQWERALTIGGNSANISPNILTPDYYFYTNDSNYYYRCKIKCGTDSIYSNWRLLNSVPGFIAGNYTINSNNPVTFIRGLVGGNFNKYDTAINAMKYCGVIGTGNVTFNVVPLSGPYAEQVKIDSIKGINISRQMIFKGNGTTLQFPTGAPTLVTERAVIKLTKADFITFDSLTIDASAPTNYGFGVQLLNNADSNTIRNCTILANNTLTLNTFAGIVINANDNGTLNTGITNCEGSIFDKNTIKGGYYGIVLNNGAAASKELLYNRVTNNKILDFYSIGLSVSGAKSSLIDGNLFSRPTRANVGLGIGVSFTGSLSTLDTISNNRFTSFYGGQPTGATGTHGISFTNIDATAGNENLVYNNAFYNLDGLGLVYALHNSGSNNVLYYHNSIAIDNPTSTATVAAAGFFQTVDATGIQFKNNIVHITRGGTGTKHCINLNTATTAANFESNTNVLYVDAAVTNGHIGFLTNNKTTLASWQNAKSPKFDSLSFNYDPLYTDAVNGDLRPQFYLIDNKAQNLGIATDILGVSRSTTPDIGAFEFTAPPCPTPLLAGTASVTPSSGLCLEEKIRLDLSGNSPVGQIYFQWQDSIANGSWQNLGPVKYSPIYDTLSSIRNYYRCIVTCAATGATVTSTVAVENLNTIMPAGTYTIDSSKITDYTGIPGQNFQTFTEAITAMKCGILGSVVFDVQKGTFNEQVRVPYVPGTSSTKTITFQGSGGVATDKILTYAAATATNNYVLRFDSCTYVTFKDLTIENTNTSFGRVVDFVTKASYDNLLSCIIKTPTTTAIANTQAAVFSNPTKGVNLTIKGNTITGGSNGINFTGTSSAAAGRTSIGHIIDSNTISSSYASGIFVQFAYGLKVSRNKVSFASVVAPSTVALLTSGIYANFCDSGLNIVNNRIDINNTTNTIAVAGISLQNTPNSTVLALCIVNGNEVYANSGNTGKVNGIYVTSSNFVDVKNNVIAINSADSTGAYGIVHNNNTGTVNYYHNSVSITALGTKTAAAQLTQTVAGAYKLTNNIFSNTGGGRSMFQSNVNNFSSDYNMLYTTGNNLVVGATTNYTTINAWRSGSGRDKWSMIYEPAFVSQFDLHPDVTNTNSWAMQGRAVQTKNDTLDINGNYRPDSLLAGVPDLGAYEFFPTVLPPVLPSIPATPTANTEQIFYFGSDTVMRIKWDLNPPPSVEVARFSGVVDSFLRKQARYDTMFFYTQVVIPGGGNYNANVKLHYLEPWLGNTPAFGSEYQLGLGKTTSGGSWTVGFGSRNNVPIKQVYENNVSYFNKFTGLFNPYAPPPPPCSENSNEGTEFWVAYPANQLNGGETYKLYLSAKTAAYVKVSIPSLNWVRTYNIPANTVWVSDQIPFAARQQNSGLYPSGIHIESDVPIVSYAHFWGAASSGATMLMPTCTWGYEYKMLGLHQNWGGGSFSSYFVIAKEDNTKISISNAVNPSGVPLSGDIVLNKGEWYQVLAASGNDDLSGSVAISVPNSQNKCLPFAMYSGDTRTLNGTPCGGGGDFAISQNFPASAWGKKYLTAPTSKSTSAGELQANLFRIALKDVNQTIWINNAQVYSNGTVALPGGGIGFSNITSTPTYVQFRADSACYINSNRPMMVAQFLSGACTGVGDPDMVYISPLEQGINNISFYRTNTEDIDVNVLTLIGASNDIPSVCEVAGIGAPCIAAVPQWNKIYPHPNYPGKSVYIKHWPTATPRQVTVSGDSAFTAITYGLGSVESYCYNAGTLINNIGAIGDTIKNFGGDPLSPDTVSQYTCARTKFKIGTVFPLLPDSITWKISGIPGITPNKDVTLTKPYGTAQTFYLKPNGDSVFIITLPDYYTIAQGGFYTLVVKWWHPDIEGCDKKREDQQFIQVVPYPKIGFDYTPNPICPNTLVNFTADTVEASTGIKVRRWGWTSNPYGINTGTLTTNTTSNFYATAGFDTVKLRYQMRDNFCIGDTALLITINPNPVVTVVSDSINVCSGASDSIKILNPLPGATYNVYAIATGGVPVATGDGQTPFFFPNNTSDATYYIECISASGCVSVDRKQVKIVIVQVPNPVANPTNITACIGTSATYNVTSPVANATYTWYDDAVIPNQVATGNTLTVNPVLINATYYLESSVNGCASATRFPVTLIAATTPSVAVVSNAVTVCSNDVATFNILNPDPTATYNWYTTATGGTATTGATFTINPATTTASYFVSATSVYGCTSSPRLQVDLTVTQRPIVTVIAPTDVLVCKGATQTFTILNPVTGVVYNWYDAVAATTPIVPNTISFTTPAVNAIANYYVDGVNAGCRSIARAVVKVTPLDLLAKPVVVGDSIYPDKIEFKWSSITGATNGYEISIDGGAYKMPTSGSFGLSHTETGLNGGIKMKATVRAKGINVCQDNVSDTAWGITVVNRTYYPNAFTPNGDGKNDKLVICGSSFKEIKYSVFNQWGEKIWETTGLNRVADCYLLWDGTQYGVLQPSGVYMFACRITFLDGKVEEKTGSISLVR